MGSQDGGVWGAFLHAIFWVLVLALDPFGAETASDIASRNFFQRIHAPFYSAAHQDQIYVVEISDDDLPLTADGHRAWPPHFGEYAELLRRLTGSDFGRPRTVFVDLLLDNEHNDDPGIQSLCAAIGEAEAAGVKVYFADLPDYEDAPRPPLILSLCERAPRAAIAGWESLEGKYPLAFAPQSTVSVGRKPELTAAAALYRDYLAQSSGPEKAAEFEARLGNAPPVSVVWGAAAPLAEISCADIGETTPDKVRAAAKIAFAGAGLFEKQRAQYEQFQPCLFHAALSAQEIARADAFDLASYHTLLDGAFVLVGARIRGIPDIVTSPVHGAVPGVYEHAMALDNLLVYGSDYIRSAPEIFSGVEISVLTPPADAIVQATLIFALALALHFFAPQGGVGAPVAAGFAKLGFGLAFFLAIFLVLSAMFAQLRWETFNWGSLASVGAIMIFSRRLARFK